MITFHYDSSTVAVDGKRFPACALVCPPDADPDEHPWHRLVGEPWTAARCFESMLVYVPMENGALACISGTCRDGRENYSLTLDHLTCQRVDGLQEWLWAPTSMEVGRDRVIRPLRGGYRRDRIQIWADCAEDWLAETLPRLAGYRVDPPFPPGPLARLIRLSEMAAIVYDRVSA